MKHLIVSIFDKATEAYMRPFTAQAEGQAVRMFEDEVLRPESEMHRHPEDYALFKIGKFDDNTGTIEPILPTCLRQAHEVKKDDV